MYKSIYLTKYLILYIAQNHKSNVNLAHVYRDEVFIRIGRRSNRIYLISFFDI